VKRHDDAGVTIVELMIAMVLMAILSGGLFYMVSGQQETYANQINLATAHSRVSGTLQLIQREIQRAGYGFTGCPGGRVQMWDQVTGMTDSPLVALQIYNDCNLLATPPASCPDGSGTDSFTVTYNNNEPAMGAMASLRLAERVTTSVPTDPASLIQLSTLGNFVRGDLVVLWDPVLPQPCVAFEVTGTGNHPNPPGRPSLWHDATGSPFNPGVNMGMPIFNTGTSAVRMGGNSWPRHFAVDINTSDPNRLPRLVTWRTLNANPSADAANAEIVAEGVEDLQLAFSCGDMDGDGLTAEGTDPAARQTDEWANNVVADNPPVCGNNNVQTVRVTLVGRSDSPLPRFRQGFRPAVEDRPAGTPADDLAATGNMGTYSRWVLSTTIDTLNLR
jgi:prepilin-type N-terminal cleavage/methylation domain-containing protein